MVDNYMTDKLLDKIKKMICIVEFDNTKIFIDTDDKLPENVTLKNQVILMECVIKNAKFYQQLFLEEALFLK